jgi:hypothetical protein
MQSMPITTNVVRSSSRLSEVYVIQHYGIKFVSDLQQVGGHNNLLSEIEVLESDISITPLPPKRARKLKKLRQSSIYEYCY